MTDVNTMLADLDRLKHILINGNEAQWAHHVSEVITLAAHDPQAGARELLGFFGAAGTLNDVVLYANGNVLISENDELDDLRKRLYKQAKVVRQS